MGWRRALSYFAHRIARLPGTPYSIAAGFACGSAVSFTPFMGLHFIFAGVLAWVLRGNMVASAIGTAVGNPWTFPLIWVLIYNIGASVLGVAPQDEEDVSGFRLSDIFDEPGRVLIPMMVGSFIVMPIAWILTFLPVRYMIASYQRRRFMRRMKKMREHKAGSRE